MKKEKNFIRFDNHSNPSTPGIAINEFHQYIVEQKGDILSNTKFSWLK